jgi:hypothetical protein
MSDREHACRTHGPFTIVSICPDVCLTPCGSAMVPIPYTICAMGENLAGTCESVKMTTNQSAHAKSNIPWCTGDEAGTGGGVKSGTFASVCEFLETKKDVRIKGEEAAMQSLLSWMNERNTVGMNLNSLSKAFTPPAIPRNKGVSEAADLTGDLAGIAGESSEAMADAIRKNIGDIPNVPWENVSQHYKDLSSQAGKLSVGGGLSKIGGVGATAVGVLTAEDRTQAVAEEALEFGAEKVLVALFRIAGWKASLAVFGFKQYVNAVQAVKDKVDAAMAEARSDAISKAYPGGVAPGTYIPFPGSSAPMGGFGSNAMGGMRGMR